MSDDPIGSEAPIDDPVEEDAPPGVGEHRWPMALAALTAGVLHELLPVDFQIGNVWLYPILMGMFLVLLIAGDPGLIDRERRWLRIDRPGGMIALIAVGNLFSAIRLVDGIINDDCYSEKSIQLLADRRHRLGDERHRVRTLVLGRRRRRLGAARHPRRVARPSLRVPRDEHARACRCALVPALRRLLSPSPSRRPLRSVPPTSPRSSAGRRCSWSLQSITSLVARDPRAGKGDQRPRRPAVTC